MGVLGLLILDRLEDLGSVDVGPALLDDGVADLADEDDQAGGSVVVLGVVPDEEDGVHDGHELLSNVGELLGGVGEVVEEVLQGLQVLVVLVGLLLGDLHFLLQLAEGGGVGALVLLEELEDLLDALGVELHADGVQVLGLVLPELDLGGGQGVVAVLERVLGVLLEDVLDLLLPVDDGGYRSLNW